MSLTQIGGHEKRCQGTLLVVIGRRNKAKGIREVPALDSPDGITWLYESYVDSIAAFFMRRVFDAEAAFDLTAEVFAQALRSGKGFRGDSAAECEAWLFAIARHQFSRYLRRGHVERRAIEKLGIQLPEVTEDDVARIEELSGSAALRTAVGQALERLSPDHQLALQLRVVDELPYETVAAQLGVSEQTARRRVSRALAALAKGLQSNPQTEGTQ